MPQQLPNSMDYSFGSDTFSRLPDFAVLIAEIITTFAWVESGLNQLSALLIGGNPTSVLTLLIAIKNDRAKKAAFAAAAKALMHERHFRVVDAYLDLVLHCERCRNDLAHGLFGFSPSNPGVLVVIDPADWSHRYIDYIKVQRGGRPTKFSTKRRARPALLMYGKAELEATLQEIQHARALLPRMQSFIERRTRQQYELLCEQLKILPRGGVKASS